MGRRIHFACAEAAGWALDRLEYLGIAILVLAALYPAAPASAVAFASGAAPPGPWTYRIGPGNVFEIGIGLLAFGFLIRSLVRPISGSRFDRGFLTLGLFLGALQCLDLPSAGDDLRYLQADAERLILIVAGYLVITRCATTPRLLRFAVYAIATAIAVRALELVVVDGLLGSTEFQTILGRSALLITEDTLLLLLPAALAWGALVDGRLQLRWMIVAIAFVTAVILVDLLSLRRGALLMILAGLFLRTLAVSPRMIFRGALVLALAFALAVAAGPGRTLFDQAKYTVTSSVLQSKDASSSQREAELQNFKRNLSGTEWVTGRGVGVLWRAEVPSPVDVATFGGEENAFTRLGWHVYGLDWAYKFGLVGVAAMLAAAFGAWRIARACWKRSLPRERWLIFSVGVCAPFFSLLALTNLRIALFAGVVLGVLSKFCDFSPPEAVTSQT